jgi:hypothetical protein
MLDSGPRSRVYAGDEIQGACDESIGNRPKAKRGGVGIDTVRGGPETIITAYPGHGSASGCPILRALTDEEQEK